MRAFCAAVGERPRIDFTTEGAGLFPAAGQRQTAARGRGAVRGGASRFRGAARAAVVEQCESRQLLTGTAFGFSGAASTDEAAQYVLTLSGSGPGASSVDHWTINWGDGNVETVPGSPTTVSHAYADGAADHTISATVTTSGGTFAARNGPAVNDADLDSAFGTGGKQKLTTIGQTTAVAPLPGGKFIAVGSRWMGSNSSGATNFMVARFNANGTLDTSFGPAGDGTNTVDFDGRDDYAAAVVVQDDGKIVVGGRAQAIGITSSDFALARFNSDGTLDDGGLGDSTPGDSFGTGGKLRRHTGPFGANYLNGLALRGDGKILASGFSREVGGYRARFTMARFDSAGALDTSFGSSGLVETNFPDSTDMDEAYAMTVQPDGKIVLAGMSDSYFAAARYTTSGNLDTTFGSGGYYVGSSLGYGTAYAAAVQADDKILLGGRDMYPSGTSGDWTLLRLTAAGSLDTSFGSTANSGGLLSTPFNLAETDGSVHALSVLPDGRFLAAGLVLRPSASGLRDFALARYNADGTLDTTFGDGGRTNLDFDGANNWLGNTYHAGSGGMAMTDGGGVLLVGGDSAPNALFARYHGAAAPKVVHVNDVAPTLSLGGAASADEGSTYTLQLSRTDPGAETPGPWVVNWGDGSAPQTVPGGQTSVGHVFADNGSYTISASTSDDDGSYTVPPKTVQVNNVAPALTVGGASASAEGDDYALTLSATDVGADTISGWTIDWGDGSATQSVGAAQAQSPVSHRYADNGAYTISVTATDEDGNHAAAPKAVTVSNVTPSLSLGGANSSAEGSSYSLSLGRTDPGADTLSNWVIDWGDGSTPQTVSGSQTSVPHTFADNGTYTITATATDDDGTFSAPSKSVEVNNVAPSVTLGGPSTVALGGGYAVTFSASDPGNDAVSAWTVNWGDGSQNSLSGSSSSASHVYGATGTFTVTVSVTDEDGTFSGSARTVTVSEPNLALNRPATASGYQVTSSNDMVAPAAVDGNSGTRWSAGGGGTQWVRVDLGTTYNLKRVKLNWEGAYATAYKIQVSDDLVTWRDAASVTNGNGNVDDLTNATGLSGNGRYVQVLCTAGPHGNYSLWDFEVYGGTDLARSRPATASGYQVTSSNDMVAPAAVDGNSGTRWSGGGGSTQWLRVDLGGVYRLTQVNLNWEAAYATGYKIQVSNDAGSWRDAATVTNGNGGSDTLTNSSGLSGFGRYVQLLCTAGPHGNYSVWDFEVSGNAEIALGRASSASGFQATSSNDMQAFAAFDGNVNTRWSAGGGGTQWLRVDLGASTRLSRVNLNWEAAYGSTYKVQVSDDAATWRDAYSTSTGNGGTDELLLTPGTNTTGRYMRIWITGGPHGNYSLWDVQVFAG